MPGAAIEQLHPELCLQLFDLVREGWLGDEQLGGCSGEVQAARDRFDVADLTKLHNPTLSI